MDETTPSLLNRLLQNPVRLRARARILAVVLAVLSGMAGSGVLDDWGLAGVTTAIVWLLVPVAAAGIGIGDAFFLRHGIGDRRVALTGLVGLVFAVTACAVLAAVDTPGSDTSLLAGVLYAVLVLGVIALLATGIAIAAGKSAGYLSRRIQDVDDTGW